MRHSGESGQTTTEFLMISGLITAITIFLLASTYVPFRAELSDFTVRMLNEMLESD